MFSGQVCGATLVHAKFILTELACAEKVMMKATGKYVVVLIGQERRTRVGLSPWAQVYSGVSSALLLIGKHGMGWDVLQNYI